MQTSGYLHIYVINVVDTLIFYPSAVIEMKSIFQGLA